VLKNSSASLEGRVRLPGNGPTRREVDLGRTGTEQLRSPGFERSLWSNLREGYPEDAVRYYLEQLTQQDCPSPSEPNSLGEILKDEATLFHEGQPRQTWTAKRTLGRGGFGDVILGSGSG
jgi:hypothetical protein